MSDEAIDATYQQCIDSLKANVSYCWDSKGGDPLKYTLGTWSNRASHSSIAMHGDDDKAKLQDPNNRHVRKQAGLTRKIQAQKENIRYPHCQKQRHEKMNV